MITKVRAYLVCLLYPFFEISRGFSITESWKAEIHSFSEYQGLFKCHRGGINLVI